MKLLLKSALLSMILLLSRLAFGVDNENRILLIGDSITKGERSTSGLGFRVILYDSLQAIGYRFTFVGSSGSAPYRGHFNEGIRIGQLYSGPGGNGTFDVSGDMYYWKPHVVHIHIGTNCIWDEIPMAPYDKDGGLNPGTASGRLAHLLVNLSKWSNGERGTHLKVIFVSTIIPNNHHPEKIEEFNEDVVRLVRDANSGKVKGIPSGILRLVRQDTSFVKSTMMDPDGTHPNDQGYLHMTGVILNTLKPYPMIMEQLSGVIQNGLQGSAAPESLSVRIMTGSGNNVPNMTVYFNRIKGDAFISSDQVNTDTSGMAWVSALFGTEDTSLVTAQVSTPLINEQLVFTLLSREYVLVSGNAHYYADSIPISGVNFKWIERDTVVEYTDSLGAFFIEALHPGESATFVPFKEREYRLPDSVILSYDAALVARHVVGLDTLAGLQRYAADVNVDDTVDIEDAFRIARYVVGLDTSDSVKIGRWFFDPAAIECDSLKEDLPGQVIVGGLWGDIHGGWTNEGENPAMKIAGNRELIFKTSSTEDTVGVEIEIEGDDILSCDFILEYDRTEALLVEISTTEQSRDFYLSYYSSSVNEVNVGMFSPLLHSGRFKLLELRFLFNSDLKGMNLKIKRLYINNQFKGDMVVTGVVADSREEKIGFKLGSSYPNPFNGESLIPFSIGSRQRVTIKIYDILGRTVRTIVDRIYEPGFHIIKWDGCSGSGERLPSGQYFVELEAGGRRDIKKLKIIR